MQFYASYQSQLLTYHTTRETANSISWTLPWTSELHVARSITHGVEGHCRACIDPSLSGVPSGHGDHEGREALVQPARPLLPSFHVWVRGPSAAWRKSCSTTLVFPMTRIAFWKPSKAPRHGLACALMSQRRRCPGNDRTANILRHRYQKKGTLPRV